MQILDDSRAQLKTSSQYKREGGVKWQMISKTASGDFQQLQSNQTIVVGRMNRDEGEKKELGARNFVC